MGISWQHLAIVLVIVLIFFGPGRLPEVFRKAGEGMRAFRDASKDGMGGGASKGESPALVEDEEEYEEVVVRRKKKKAAAQIPASDDLDDPPASVAKGTVTRSES
jgi:sec-independent protein translocase protein TatA